MKDSQGCEMSELGPADQPLLQGQGCPDTKEDIKQTGRRLWSSDKPFSPLRWGIFVQLVLHKGALWWSSAVMEISELAS